MKEYILYGLVVSLVLYSVTISFMLNSTKNDLLECSTKAERQATQLAKQLASIKQLELDTETYKNQMPLVQKKIEYRYKTIQEVDRTCMEKLDAIREMEKIFKTRGLR